jgi:hypothetical protein
MEIQQQKSSALLARNVSAIVSSQNKIKSAVSKFFTNINHHSYNNAARTESLRFLHRWALS